MTCADITKTTMAGEWRLNHRVLRAKGDRSVRARALPVGDNGARSALSSRVGSLSFVLTSPPFSNHYVKLMEWVDEISMANFFH